MTNPNAPLESLTTAEIIANTKQRIRLEADILKNIQAISIDPLTNNMETVAQAIRSQESSNNILSLGADISTLSDLVERVKIDTRDNALVVFDMQTHQTITSQQLGGLKDTVKEHNGRINNMENAYVSILNETAVLSNSHPEQQANSTAVMTVESVRELTKEELGELINDHHYLLPATMIDGKNVYPQGTCPDGFVQAFQDGTQKACAREICNNKDTDNFVEFKLSGETDSQICTMSDSN